MPGRKIKRTPTRLSEVKTEYLLCQVFNHRWDRYNKLGRRTNWGSLFSRRCDTCTAERHDVIDLQGNLSTREYVYPEDYVRLGTIEDRRKELIRREKRKQITSLPDSEPRLRVVS